MASLKIRYVNNICRIECIDTLFPAFCLHLEEILKQTMINKNNVFKAYFIFPFELDEKQSKTLFSLCEKYHTYIIGINNKENEKVCILKEHCFYNGQTYYLKEECIYIGDIEKEVHIISNHTLYVVGKIKGIVDLLNPECEIHASSFEEARIRIFDSLFHKLTNSAPAKVYYEKKEVKIK